MQTAHVLRLTVVSAILLGLAGSACAQAPSPAPPTIWKFLGIPQAAKKISDGVLNRKGNHPNLEPKPPLKPIADPANLESPVQAIKAAAEIKAQEDLKDQKIKAIKYLAEVGCACYPGVKEALLAALDDCTEEVRYQAAIAFCEASGNPCKACNPGSCCDEASMKKLKDIAVGQDENGCYKETSPRVRAAASNALNACERVVPPVEVPKEVPVEALPKELAPPSIEELPAEKTKTAAPAGSDGETSVPVNPVSVSQAPQLTDELPPDAVAGLAGCRPTCRAYCGCRVCCRRRLGRCRPCPGYEGRPVAPTPGEALAPVEPGEKVPGEKVPGETPTEEPLYPPPTALAGTFGAAAGPQSVVPNMIGDLFGTASSQSTVIRSFTFNNLGLEQTPTTLFYTTLAGDTRVALQDAALAYGPSNNLYPIEDFNDASGRLGGLPLASVPAGGTLVQGTTTDTTSEGGPYNSVFDVAYVVDVPNPGSGGVVGRMKIAENTSPLPRDRLLFNYSYFENVPLYPGGVNVNRFTVGFEKTFCDGLASFELKAPMAMTLQSTFAHDGRIDFSHGEFGNLGLTFKGLLLRRRTWALAGGLMVTAPTAEDTHVVTQAGTPLVRVRNDSVHVAPFFGFVWTPNDRFFAQGFLQYDVDTSGCPVYVNQGNGLMPAGRINDTTFQYLDVGMGSWIYRTRSRCACVRAVAWTAELHWNYALDETDYVRAGSFQVGDRLANVEVFNAVLGVHAELARNTTVTLGYATPLGGGRDQQFDGELRLMVNRRFGPQSRASRVPFY